MINVYPVELVDMKQPIDVDHEDMGPSSKEILRSSIYKWKIAVRLIENEDLTACLKLVDLSRDSRQLIFNNKGLINEFAHLNTKEQIIDFSNKYGLLGISAPDSEQLNSIEWATRQTIHPKFIYNNYGHSVFEPINLWFWHIKKAQNILKLYNAIKNNPSEDRINNIIEVRLKKGRFESLDENRSLSERYFVYWIGGDEIGMLPKDMENESFTNIGKYALSEVLSFHISKGINLGVKKIIYNPTLKIVEQKYTSYLLAAIYYDLWQTINEERNIAICANNNCGLPFEKNSKRKYCSNACKQEAYRNRIKLREDNYGTLL